MISFFESCLGVCEFKRRTLDSTVDSAWFLETRRFWRRLRPKNVPKDLEENWPIIIGLFKKLLSPFLTTFDIKSLSMTREIISVNIKIKSINALVQTID